MINKSHKIRSNTLIIYQKSINVKRLNVPTKRLDLICLAKDTITIKEQNDNPEGEMVSGIHISKKELLSRMYQYFKNYHKSILKEQMRQEKMDKNLNKHITKKNTQVANKHIKNVLNFINHLGIPIRITMRYHYTPIRRTEMKKT